MILSNVEIVACLKDGLFKIEPLGHTDPSKAPFNTSSVDLKLGTTITVPLSDTPAQIDIRSGGIANYLARHSEKKEISHDQPYSLMAHKFVLGTTYEHVNFPIESGKMCYSARVEGRSSLARFGILVHFTAPTIHAGFEGNIALEIINLGPSPFLLFPQMKICQLIIEEVRGTPVAIPSQFQGQNTAAGLKSEPTCRIK